MSKKIYDAIMLLVAICMLIITYLTYDATTTMADEAGPSHFETTERDE